MYLIHPRMMIRETTYSVAKGPKIVIKGEWAGKIQKKSLRKGF
jgi:hypothetical protein